MTSLRQFKQGIMDVGPALFAPLAARPGRQAIERNAFQWRFKLCNAVAATRLKRGLLECIEQLEEGTPIGERRQLIGAGGGMVGGGATHAWLQVYLPGAGWVEFDPTNALIGGRNLIRVAVARNASQAAPVAGAFTGAPDDFLSMNVTVEVTAE